jgi:hypothetical protein
MAQRAMNANPNLAVARACMGWALLKKGDAHGALVSFQQALIDGVVVAGVFTERSHDVVMGQRHDDDRLTSSAPH